MHLTFERAAYKPDMLLVCIFYSHESALVLYYILLRTRHLWYLPHESPPALRLLTIDHVLRHILCRCRPR